MSAEQFKEFKETESEERVQAYFDSLLFKSFNIMVKGKFEFFNGENRMRFFAVKVFPHNVQAENRALLRRLEIYRCLESLGQAGGAGSSHFDDQEMNFQQ
jgi:hypothetical protein